MNTHAPSSTIVPRYEDVVERNAIARLVEPGDLTIRGGSIAVTKRGNIMLNDEVYSALFNLVTLWRYNFSTMQSLFLSVFDMNEELEQKSKLNRIGSLSLALPQGYAADSYHAIKERLYAMKEARKVYAGSITLIIGQALAAFRIDIDANMDDWHAAGPLTNGHSVGDILTAAGNNMRHYDEWQTTTKANKQQLSSIRAISSVLGIPMKENGDIRGFGKNICPEILEILSKKDFLVLERRIFDFAQDLAARRNSRNLSS